MLEARSLRRTFGREIGNHELCVLHRIAFIIVYRRCDTNHQCARNKYPRENKIENHTGDDDRRLYPPGLGGECARLIRIILHKERVLAIDTDIPADGERIEGVVGLPFFDTKNTRRKSEGEFINANLK